MMKQGKQKQEPEHERLAGYLLANGALLAPAAIEGLKSGPGALLLIVDAIDEEATWAFVPHEEMVAVAADMGLGRLYGAMATLPRSFKARYIPVAAALRTEDRKEFFIIAQLNIEQARGLN